MMKTSLLAAAVAGGLVLPATPPLVFPKPAIIKPENLEFSKHMLLGMPLTMGMLPKKGLDGIIELYRSTTAVHNGNTTSTYTFNNVPIGPGATDRRVYVCVAIAGANSNGTVNSVSIGGGAGTLDVKSAAGYSTAAIASRALQTGTTANIVVTTNNNQNDCTIFVVSLSKMKSATPVDSASSRNSPSSSNRATGSVLDWKAGGYVLAVAADNGPAGNGTVHSYGAPLDTFSVASDYGAIIGVGTFAPENDALNQNVVCNVTNPGATGSLAVVSLN